MNLLLQFWQQSYAEHENYKCNTNIQLLTYVKEMPDELKKYMKGSLYILDFSKQIQEHYYINHCGLKTAM